MPANVQDMIYDLSGRIAPQLFDPALDTFNYLYGRGNALLVDGVLPFRDDLDGAAYKAANWTRTAGAGMSEAIAASVSAITAGTTAASLYTLKSVKAFTAPVRVWWIYNLSQRIANQTVFFEILNAAGDMAAGWQIDGVTATQAKYYVTNAGTTDLSGAVTIPTSATYAILEVEFAHDEVYFTTRLVDSTAARQQQYVKTVHLPDPAQPYFVQTRILNGTTPATSTVLNLDAILILNYSELVAEVTGGRGTTNANQGIGVSVISNAAAAQVTGATNRIVWQSDSSATLGIGATFTGVGRDMVVAAAAAAGFSYGLFRAAVWSDVAGTLYIDESDDNATWNNVDSIAVPANLLDASGLRKTTVIEDKVYLRYARVRYVNGATGQATFFLRSAQVATA